MSHTLTKLALAVTAAGGTVTITGKLVRGRTPVAGAAVPLSFCNDDLCGEPGVTPITDAAGRYRETVTPIRTGHYHADSIDGSSADTANIVVLQPAKITTFTTARDSAGKVAATGTIDFPGFTPSPVTVQLQYLSGPGCWTTATTTDATWNGTTFAFTASTDHPAPGVWRAFYPGTPDFFHSATSTLAFVR